VIYEIRTVRSAERDLRALPTAVVRRVVHSFEALAKDPRPHGCKKLMVEGRTLWRIRIGAYRVIYAVDDMVRIVRIQKVGHRRDVYRGI
jgi:mRNA interferase RelE/StbE